MTTDKRQHAYNEACRLLGNLEKCFVKPVKLTVIVRSPGFPEQDFLVSDDDMAEIIKLVERRRDADEALRNAQHRT